ncbi:MAG: enoyl-ACP reductase [Armatimonadota bacterium]
MLDLTGRKALVMGVANDSSLAWGIAQSLAAAGAELALSYLPDPRGRNEGRVRRLAEPLGCRLYLPCDALKDEDIDGMFATLHENWGALDVLVHSIAAARTADLGGEFTAVSRGGFSFAHEVSCYSLIAAARGARRLMDGRPGSIVTLTYLGSQRAVPNYNVMGVAKAALESTVRYLALELGAAGIRVNAVSPGPIETLSSSVIAGFPEMMRKAADQAPLRRNVTPREVGDAVAFLCSDLSRGITGQVLYVDAGFSIAAGV